MTMIGAYEAKTHLPQLLERVAKGESITITKHGVPVAVLSPPPARPKMTPEEAIEGIRRLREEIAARGIRFTAKEIKEMIHEGHKY
jgi:prevent-host-death family protein